MSWPLVISGATFILMSVASLIAPLVSEHRRQVLEATDVSRYSALLPAAAGIPIVVAGLWPNVVTIVVAIVAFCLVGVLSKRLLGKVQDPPPGIARLRERPLNPLPRLAHPIRSLREDIDLMKAVGNREEQRRWEASRGIERRAKRSGRPSP